MGGHIGRRRGVVIVLSVVALLTTSSGWAAASSAPATPPADVATFAQGPALKVVQAMVEGDSAQSANAKAAAADMPAVPDFSGVLRSSAPREVFTFSSAFLAGQPGPDAVASAAQWIAPVQRGRQILGTMTIWKPRGAPEVAHVDGDVELGTALNGMRNDELFVMDERTAEFFAMRGDSIRPLNANARRELASAASVADLRAVVSARIREQNAHDQGVAVPVGGGGPVATTGQASLLTNWWFNGGVLVTILGALLLALAFWNRRRPSSG